MLELEEAMARMVARIRPLGTERMPVAEAAGRILAEPLVSPVPLPLFDNSAFDGYAVRARDVANAAADSPLWLKLCGTVAAGDAPDFTVEPGTAARIFTGAMLPDGADAVVMQEDTVSDSAARPGEIGVLDPVKPWEAVRLRGEELKAGAPLLERGTMLGTGACGLLAAVGCADVPVARRPVVGLLSTGSELRLPGEPLARGQIYESNRAQLLPLLRACGAAVCDYGLVPDDLAATETVLRRGLEECDALITSGGVSVGELDHVRDAFVGLGGTIDFWKVAVKPGKPFVFGEHGGKHLFGLPGNPVSSWVTFWLMVRPALLAMQGAAELSPPTSWGELEEPLRNPGNRRHFVRVVRSDRGKVRTAGIQGSHALAALARANGLVDVPPGAVLETGSRVEVLLLP